MKPALLCLLFLLLSPSALALDGTGVLSGTVLADDGTVLQDVVVTATSPNLMGEQTVVTDENGFYWIPQLPPGIYLLRFEGDGYYPHTVQVVVRLNQGYRMNVGLMADGYGRPVWPEQRSISVPCWPRRRPPPPPPSSPFAVFDQGYQSGSGTWAPSFSSLSNTTALELYFQGYGVNPTVETVDAPISNFPVDGDVDTISYSQARDFLEDGALPYMSRVRVEDFVNLLDHDYPSDPDAPFTVHVEGFPSPSRPGFHVLRIGLKAREVPRSQRKASHLVLAIEDSISMTQAGRSDMVKEALRLLLDTLDERDRVSIVAYGRQARVVLPPTSALQRDLLLGALDGLHTDSADNLQAGLDLAWSLATDNRVEGGINRVILFSSGVAHTDVAEESGIWARVKGFAGRGITLSAVVLGDSLYLEPNVERLARVGGGNHAYVNRRDEVRGIFLRNLTGLRPRVANVVEARLALDVSAVVRYRQVGHELRIYSPSRPPEDWKDADEVHSGHAATTLYEVKLRGGVAVGSLGRLRLRYTAPEDGISRDLVTELPASILRDSYASASPSARLAYVAAAFAEKLRDSYWVRALSWKQLIGLFEEVGEPLRGRPEVGTLGDLIRRAAALDRRGDRFEAVAPLSSMDFDREPRL